MSYVIRYSNELRHHGIKGQKWGQRNGPPYPLDYEDKSSSEQKAGSKIQNGIRKASDQTTPKKGSFLSNLTPEQKKAIKTGAIVVGAALVVGGGIYVASKTGALRNGVGYNARKAMFSNRILSDALRDYPNKGVKLKKGSVLQRMSSDSIDGYKRKGELYVSHLFGDNATYKNQFGDHDVVHEIKTARDIKAPGMKETAEIFDSLNPGSKEGTFHMFMNQVFLGNADEMAKNDSIGEYFLSKKEPFISELRKRGYNAILDDTDYGSVAKSPLILLDPGGTIASDKARKLNEFEKVISKPISDIWRKYNV